MNLRCYIVGDPVSAHFTVPIDPNNNVGALRQSIKTAVSRFKDVDAHHLRLHQVNVPARNLEDELKHVNWNLPLYTTQKISVVFLDPDPDNVHVVVMLHNVVLRCLVLGETAHDIFEISILSNQDVTALRAAVKKERDITFKDTESANIRLFQVSLPIDDALPGKLADLDVNKLHELSSPIEKISQLLEYPFDNLRIVVFPPSFLLRCLVSGDPPASFFNIRIPSNQSIASLKVRVKEAIPGRLPGDVTTFNLYLADLPPDELEIFDIDREHPLQPLQNILQVFPIPQKGHVHIIVAVCGTNRSSSPKLSALERLKRSRLIQDSPSVFGARYYINQVAPEVKIMDDRPRPDPYIAPIALLFSGFGRFEDIVAHREGIVGEEWILRRDFEDFANSMCEIYRTEAERQKVALDKLNKMLVISRISASSVGEGHCSCPGPNPIPNTAVGIRDELTGIRSDPVRQLITYIANLHLESHHPHILNEWRLPCLGITIVGPEVAFHAIISLASNYRVVTIARGSCMRSVSAPGGDRNSLYTAFVAASILQADIADYFSRSQLPRSIDSVHRWPAVSKLKKEGSSTEYIKFKITANYHVQIDRYMYYADLLPTSDTSSTTQGGDTKHILVKFSRTYGIDLHRFCFDKGHAPRIFGFERLPGGWYGIAMEVLRHVQPIADKTEVASNLRNLVEQFHAEGMVHGDLRAANILCRAGGLCIIDFDWAGKEGEAQYPTLDLDPQLREGRTSMDPHITRHDDLQVPGLTLQR